MRSERAQRYGALTEQRESSRLLRPPVTRPHVTRGSWVGYTASYDAEAAGVDIDTFAQALQAEGLLVLPRSYHPLLHRSSLFTRFEDGYRRQGPFTPGKRVYAEGDFPVAEAHADRQLAFPLFLDKEAASQAVTPARQVPATPVGSTAQPRRVILDGGLPSRWCARCYGSCRRRT